MTRRVLVVDDNPVSRELVREVLESPGLQVIEAANGREALARIEESMPELVLLDLRMPLPDGYRVLEEIKQDARFGRIRVMAFTAYAMRGDSERALAAGFDGYITKPIDAVSLREQVERWLAHREGS
jgi:CheY-like chemotaxis protein